MPVLEFTTPESPFAGGARISWHLQPHVVCRYQVDLFRSSKLRPSREVPREAELWIEDLVVEDASGRA